MSAAAGVGRERSMATAGGGWTGFLVAVLLISAAAACAEPPVFPDWTIPVPDGVAAREYEVAALDSRAGDRIELVADLSISDAAGAAFFRPREIVVDEGGRMYVLDAGNHRVQVFDADGAFLRSFGSQGQGPGELMLPAAMVWADGSIVINDFATGRLSTWSSAGEHLGDHSHRRSFRPPVVFGDRDTLVAAYAEEVADGFPLNVTARFDLNGEQIERIAAVPMRGLVRVRVGADVSADYAEGYNALDIGLDSDIQPRFALARDGTLYLAAGDQYQVLALDGDGAPRWALRTTLPMPEMPLAFIDALVQSNDRVSSRSDFDWDPLLPAIESIRVDGHGHLWVYPTVARTLLDVRGFDGAPWPRPVDVYSSDGELLFSGQTDAARWHVALGDFVYSLGVDPRTDEPALVRYRVVEPFD